ncbi:MULTISPECIES: glycosyltransferase family 87 protein [unclassified Rhizobium]|uniref:glycosyltransferase family 87 protein n=1 Tax=unclassified Rhizobium TaxID=2613769 RepID=UPI0037FBFE08
MARPRAEQFFAALIVALGLVCGLYLLKCLWTLTPDGLSRLSDRLPYWDFTNLWGGTVMAVKGNVAYLFDVEAYRRELRLILSPLLPNQEWSYPPSMLLIGIPLTGLPVFVAYIAWTSGTLLLLFWATKLLELAWWLRVLIVASPAAIMDVVFGQNGALTTALLLSGLLLAPSRPIIAGVLFGLLTIKPQLGLLVPFCLLASGNYRSILSAGATAVFLVVMTGLLFGFEVWWLFLTETRPLMTAILEAPFPQSYQMNAVTIFMLARSFGFGPAASYAFQLIASVAAIVSTVWLWRGKTSVDHGSRVCLTATLALVAMPYGYIYDTIPLSVAILYFFVNSRGLLPLLCSAWLHPLFNQQVAASVVPLGALFPAGLAICMLIRILRDSALQETGAVAAIEEAPIKAS